MHFLDPIFLLLVIALVTYLVYGKKPFVAAWETLRDMWRSLTE